MLKTVSNQQHHWRKPKKRSDRIHSKRPSQKQCGTNIVINFFQRNNGNTCNIQRRIVVKIRSRSDLSRNVMNL